MAASWSLGLARNRTPGPALRHQHRRTLDVAIAASKFRRCGWYARPGALAGDQLARALVLIPGTFEQLAPGDHVGPAPQQRAALTLGHAAPDAELDAVVERVG